MIKAHIRTQIKLLLFLLKLSLTKNTYVERYTTDTVMYKQWTLFKKMIFLLSLRKKFLCGIDGSKSECKQSSLRFENVSKYEII